MASFSQASPPTPCAHRSPPPIRATCPAHLIRLDFTTRTILGKECRSFSSSLCGFLHSPVTSSLLGPNTLLNTLFSNTLRLRSSLSQAARYECENKIKYSNLFTFMFCPSLKFWKGWHKKYVGLIAICWLCIRILSRRYLFESVLMPITTMTKFPTLWNLKHSYYELESHSGHRHKHALYFLVFSRAGRGHWTAAQSEIQIPPKLLKFAFSTTGTGKRTWSVKFRETGEKQFK